MDWFGVEWFAAGCVLMAFLLGYRAGRRRG